MKKLFFGALASLAMTACATTEAPVEQAQSDYATVFELPNSKLHVIQTGTPLGDVAMIVEGKKSLVLMETPGFTKQLGEFKDYVKTLDKPVEKVISSYHPAGLAEFSDTEILMPNSMIAFGKTPAMQGILKKFAGMFGDAMDQRPAEKVTGFDIPTKMTISGVELDFTPGQSTDFPAASIQIDSKAFYTHFAPAVAHLKPMQIGSIKAVDAKLAEMNKIKASGAEYIVGSHGVPSTQAEVEWTIKYLEDIKKFHASSDNSDAFAQKLMVAYPLVNGVENIKAIAAALYAGEKKNPVKEEVRARLNDYLTMVSDLDMNIAEGLWAKDDAGISIIAPRGQYFGYESIKNDFFLRAFSHFKSRKLSSLSEVINVYGTSANVQLYWKFETETKEGEKAIGRGRETLIFEKMKGEWRLVHVHYSVMPK